MLLLQLAIQLYTRRSVDFVPSIRCTLSTGQTCFEPATNCKQFACADATGDPPGCGVRFFSALPQSLPDGAESSPSRAPTLSPPPSSLESFQASSCRLRRAERCRFCAGRRGVKPVTAEWWGGQQRLFLIVGSAGCLRSLSL